MLYLSSADLKTCTLFVIKHRCCVCFIWSNWLYNPINELLNKIFQSIDIGAIISERLSAFKKLQENPNDIDAVMALGKVQEKVQAIALLHLINKNYDLCFKLWEFTSLFSVENLFNFKENVKGIYTGIWGLVREIELRIKRNFFNFNNPIYRLVCGLSPKIFQASS